MPVRVTALYTYPIKSCGRLEHMAFTLEERGPSYDRRWMVVSDVDGERGMFLTQREIPRLALVQPSFVGDALAINAPGQGEIYVPLAQRDAPTHQVVVWRDTCRAIDEGDAVAVWLTRHLDYPARLVRMDDSFVRAVDPAYALAPAQVGFADGYPLLLAADESLAELNRRLQLRGKATLPMSRFRPNVVVSGDAAFAEDDWRHITIGGVPFDVVKRCARCVTTTVDQGTGTIPDPKEPLATLETFRRAERGVMFGQNVIHRAGGTLRVGDEVTVAEAVAR